MEKDNDSGQMARDAEVMQGLHNGSLKERGVELCVNCPMENAYVPADGHCYKFRLREDGKLGVGGVRLHAQPNDLYYDGEAVYEHAWDLSFGAITRDLKGVVCDFKED